MLFFSSVHEGHIGVQYFLYYKLLLQQNAFNKDTYYNAYDPLYVFNHTYNQLDTSLGPRVWGLHDCYWGLIKG